MTPGNKDRDGPPPADDEGRSLLFGWSKEDEEAGEGREQPSPPPASASSAAPPATVPAAKDVADTQALPDLAGTLASLAAGQRHILAMLGDIAAADGEGRAGVSEIARMIADMKQMTTATSEWTNQTKSVTHTLHAASGQQIEGLKGGQRDLRAVAAELKIREEGIAGRLETFGKAVRELDTLLKGLDRRSSELEELKQELAGYYDRWTAALEPVLTQMTTLSERLNAGDHMVTRFEKHARSWTETMAKSMGTNAAEQRAAAEQTSGNVGKLAEAGDALLERFDAGSREALAFFRREWRSTRRWTVPLLAAALVLAAPSFAVLGAMGQREFVVFKPYDDTKGWKQGVWKRHGMQVKGCLLEAGRTKSVFRCSFDVTYP